jgi:hypothetical protein
MIILQSKITGTQTSFSNKFGDKPSFILSFLFPERLHCCYICFRSPYMYHYYNYSLKPCALNAYLQHFVLRFNKISLLRRWCDDTTERGDRGWKQGQRQGEDRVTLLITLLGILLFISLNDAQALRFVYTIHNLLVLTDMVLAQYLWGLFLSC